MNKVKEPAIFTSAFKFGSSGRSITRMAPAPIHEIIAELMCLMIKVAFTGVSFKQYCSARTKSK